MAEPARWRDPCADRRVAVARLRLEVERSFSDADGVIAVMMVIFLMGVVVDAMAFEIERAIRRRYGLIDEGAAD